MRKVLLQKDFMILYKQRRDRYGVAVVIRSSMIALFKDSYNVCSLPICR